MLWYFLFYLAYLYTHYIAASKEKRAPSAYNIFMKTEVEKVKKANPSLKPAEAFKAAALNVTSNNEKLKSSCTN